MNAFVHRGGGPWVAFSMGWWGVLLWGAANVVLGIFLLTAPIASAVALVTVMAFFWIVGGVIEVVKSILERGTRWGWSLAGGAVAIVVGLLILAYPLYATLVGVGLLYLLFAASALVIGVTMLVSGHSVGTAILGLLLLLIGVLMLFNPLHLVALAALVQWIGLLTVVGGICTALSALFIRGEQARL
ncbi:MAG TPA: DUF308 domain-containing protein [Chloroflexota bacterium]|nr:DUF308 domain-containing protein [Chloroflexota bacterium]